MEKLLPFVLLYLLVTPSGSMAQETLVHEDPEAIIVIGIRYKENLAVIPANAIVITEQEVKSSTAQNIPELLKTKSDIHIADMTGNKRFYNVDLRGFGATAPLNTLVLVDGRRVTQPNIMGTDWLQIPFERVERIEVIRGGRGSVLYGDNATGGVVNIITKDGDTPEKNVQASLGSHDTSRLSTYAGGRRKNLSYNISAGCLNTNGYRKNSEIEAKDFGLKLNYSANDCTQFNLSSGYHKDKAGIPGMLKKSDLDTGLHRTNTRTPDDYSEVRDYYFHGGSEMCFWRDSIFSLNASYRKRKSFSHYTIGGGHFEGDTEIVTKAFSPQLLVRKNFENASNTLTLGFDHEDVIENIVNDSTFTGESAYTLKKKNRAMYLYDKVEFDENWHFSAGYRDERTRYEFNTSNLKEDKNIYTLGVVYDLRENSSMFASYSRSFRYPALDEYYSFFFDTLNPALRPQVSDDHELGLRYQLDATLSASITIFRVDTKDEIFSDPTTFTSDNLDGKTCRTGIELSLVKNFNKLVVSGHYTWIKAVIEDGIRSGKDIPNVPCHRLSTDATYDIGSGFTLALNGQYVGKRPFISDFNNDFAHQKAYTVFNAKLRHERESVSYFINLNNITNVEYSGYALIDGGEEAYCPSPKFNVTVGIVVKL